MVPVLQGEQGIGKSGLVQMMGLGWAGVLSYDLDNLQRMVESILRRWVLEIAEMAGNKRSEAADVKRFITTTEDQVRLAYRRNGETFKRQSVYIATVNEMAYLRDPTGSTRFFPVESQLPQNTPLDFAAAKAEMMQVWAEAVALCRDRREEAGDAPCRSTSPGPRRSRSPPICATTPPS